MRLRPDASDDHRVLRAGGVLTVAASRTSAGVLLWRRRDGRIEVLLGHPGGPFFARKDGGVWSVLKGETSPGEKDLEALARREFEEETGHAAPRGPTIELGEVRQAGGKLVVCWAVEGDLDPDDAFSNTFEMEWPPRSGRTQEFPEIDRVAWFDLASAREAINLAQAAFLDRLDESLR
jgi:predicted NUDIX family NTP pyrophosphohydrolase